MFDYGCFLVSQNALSGPQCSFKKICILYYQIVLVCSDTLIKCSLYSLH